MIIVLEYKDVLSEYNLLINLLDIKGLIVERN